MRKPLSGRPLIAKAADLGTFSDYAENSELLRKLNKRLKLFRGEDGWFARGARASSGNTNAANWGLRLGHRG